MRIIRGLTNIPVHFSGCVATIGNFDGMHLGHHTLIHQLLKKSTEFNLPSVLITFEPQPNEFFAKEKAPARLMRFREKWLALQRFNVDYLVCLRFNTRLATLSATEFIKTVLVQRLKVAHVIVGDDFHFGTHRTGDILILQQEGQKWHFTAEGLNTYEIANQRVSSSQIRLHLQQGDMEMASILLGHHYCMSGRVAHGHKRGRIIGFPTANIFLHRKTVPISGVYAVKIHDLEKTTLYGVANVGIRPTVDGTHSLLEVHLFDFNQDIYGRHIRVEFVKKLRDEKRYDSFELLKKQILKDAQNAKDYFKMTRNKEHRCFEAK